MDTLPRKRLTYTKAHNLGQLGQEVVTAFPAQRDRISVEGVGDQIVITVPADTLDTAVAAVVTAHVPNADYGIDPQRRQAAQYLRNTIAPLLPGLIDGTGTLTNAQRDRSIAALCILVKGLYQQDR